MLKVRHWFHSSHALIPNAHALHLLSVYQYGSVNWKFMWTSQAGTSYELNCSGCLCLHCFHAEISYHCYCSYYVLNDPRKMCTDSRNNLILMFALFLASYFCVEFVYFWLNFFETTQESQSIGYSTRYFQMAFHSFWS